MKKIHGFYLEYYDYLKGGLPVEGDYPDHIFFTVSLYPTYDSALATCKAQKDAFYNLGKAMAEKRNKHILDTLKKMNTNI